MSEEYNRLQRAIAVADDRERKLLERQKKLLEEDQVDRWDEADAKRS